MPHLSQLLLQQRLLLQHSSLLQGSVRLFRRLQPCLADFKRILRSGFGFRNLPIVFRCNTMPTFLLFRLRSVPQVH